MKLCACLYWQQQNSLLLSCLGKCNTLSICTCHVRIWFEPWSDISPTFPNGFLIGIKCQLIKVILLPEVPLESFLLGWNNVIFSNLRRSLPPISYKAAFWKLSKSPLLWAIDRHGVWEQFLLQFKRYWWVRRAIPYHCQQKWLPIRVKRCSEWSIYVNKMLECSQW